MQEKRRITRMSQWINVHDLIYCVKILKIIPAEYSQYWKELNVCMLA